MRSTFHIQTDEPDPILPRWTLITAAVAVAGTIVIAAIGGTPMQQQMGPSTVTGARSLIFTDASDGAVLVTDATNHAHVARLAPGTNGFIRATLRGLAHSGSHEVTPLANHPFLLTALSDGRLTLDDPVSGRKLDLEAFGSLNSAAFAALLTTEETP